jgi:hypothetical protein
VDRGALLGDGRGAKQAGPRRLPHRGPPPGCEPLALPGDRGLAERGAGGEGGGDALHRHPGSAAEGGSSVCGGRPGAGRADRAG